MVARAAQTALQAATRLQQAIVAHPGAEFPRTLAAIANLETSIDEELERDHVIQLRGRRGRPVTLKQLRRRVYTLEATVARLEQAQERQREALQNRITDHWLVRAGLSDPSTSIRSLSEWCQDFAISHTGEAPLSKSSVPPIRDAFAQQLKEMTAAGLSNFAASLPHGFLLIRHIHDEAQMRLRSHMVTAPGEASEGVRRGRFSKIQNNVVTVHRSASSSDFLRWPCA